LIFKLINYLLIVVVVAGVYERGNGEV